MKVIKGTRARLEQEAVAALLDPNGKNRSTELFARLERRGLLRCIHPALDSSNAAGKHYERHPLTDSAKALWSAKGGAISESLSPSVSTEPLV